MAKIRASRTEFKQRIFIIQGWIIDNTPSALMVQQILLKQWCTTERHAERMIAAARREWVKHETTNIDEKRKLMILSLKQRQRSMKEEYKGTPAGIRALAYLDKMIIELEGLKVIKVEHSGLNGEPIKHDHNVTLSVEEIKQIGKALENEY